MWKRRKFILHANGRSATSSSTPMPNCRRTWYGISSASKSWPTKGMRTNVIGIFVCMKRMSWPCSSVTCSFTCTWRIWKRWANNCCWRRNRCPHAWTILGDGIWFAIPIRTGICANGKTVATPLIWFRTISIMCAATASTRLRRTRRTIGTKLCSAIGWTARRSSPNASKWLSTWGRTRASDLWRAPIVGRHSTPTSNFTIISSVSRSIVRTFVCINLGQWSKLVFCLHFRQFQVQRVLPELRHRGVAQQSHVHAYQLHQMHHVRYDVPVARCTRPTFPLPTHQRTSLQMHPMRLWVSRVLITLGVPSLFADKYRIPAAPSPNGTWTNTFWTSTKSKRPPTIATSSAVSIHACLWIWCGSTKTTSMVKGRTSTVAIVAVDGTRVEPRCHGISSKSTVSNCHRAIDGSPIARTSTAFIGCKPHASKAWKFRNK